MASFLEVLPSDVNHYIFGFLPTIDLIVQLFVCKQTNKLAFQVLPNREYLPYFHFCTEAVQLGYFEVLKWLKELEYDIRVKTYTLAAEKGNVKIFKWLVSFYSKLPSLIFQAAAKSSNPKIFDCVSLYKCSNKVISEKDHIIAVVISAIKGGNIKLATGLIDKHTLFVMTNSAQLICRIAAVHNQLEFLRWCLDQYPYTHQYELCTAAARGGSLETLKWCIDGGFNYSDTIYEDAANGGNMEIIHYLCEIGAPFNNSCKVSQGAAERGNLSMLKWLYENDYLCTSCASGHTVFGGHLELFKWLQSINCKVLIWIWGAAMKHGTVDFIEHLKPKWLTEQHQIQNLLLVPNITYEEILEITKWIRLNRSHFTALFTGPLSYKEIITIVRVDMQKHREYFEKHTQKIDKTD